MNAKKAKKIRRAMKHMSPRHAEYAHGDVKRRHYETGARNPNGSIEMGSYLVHGTVHLKEGSGRHIYKKMKASA